MKTINTNSSKKKNKQNSTTGHTIISYCLGLIAPFYMLFLYSKYSETAWGPFTLFQFAIGISGWAYILMSANQPIIPNQATFVKIDENMLLYGILVFSVNIALQFILNASLAISSTEMAMYTIFASVCEELGFRGLLQPLLEKAVGPLFAVILQAFAFAYAHVSYYGTYMFYSVLIGGLLYGIMYWWRKDITTVIIAHAILNLIAAIQFLGYGVISA